MFPLYPNYSCNLWVNRCSGGRYPAAQARPEGLRLGLVPRRGRLHRQASRHGLGEQLGGHGAGHPDPVVPRADPLSAAVGPRALARRGQSERCGLGGGDARRGPPLVPRSTDRPDRGWRLRGPRLARGLGPAGSVRGADARRRGDLRSAGAAPARWQARPQAAEGIATAQPREVASRADRNRDGQEPWAWATSR